MSYSSFGLCDNNNVGENVKFNNFNGADKKSNPNNQLQFSQAYTPCYWSGTFQGMIPNVGYQINGGNDVSKNPFINPISDVNQFVRSIQTPPKPLNQLRTGGWSFIGPKTVNTYPTTTSMTINHSEEVVDQVIGQTHEDTSSNEQVPFQQSSQQHQVLDSFRLQCERNNTYEKQAPASPAAMEESSSDLLAFLRLSHANELSTNEPVSLNNGINKTESIEEEIDPMQMYSKDYSDVVNSHIDPRNISLLSRKPNRPEISTGPCTVCEADKAGFHFGAIACAACSAFFRRTISEKRKYVCRKDGSEHMKCPIDKHHRCYCRACRLQKCLAQGMDPMAVQPHRDSIGAKQPTNNGPICKQLLEAHREKMSSASSPNPFPELKKLPKASEANTMTLIEDAFRGHLNKNTTSFPSASCSIDSKDSTTAQLLTQTSLAEQLLAFSKAPVFSKQNDTTSNNFLVHVAPNGLIVPKTELDTDSYDFSRFDGSSSRMDMADETGASSSMSSSQSPVNMTYDPHQNMIEIMVIEYRKLLERRRLIYCPSTIRDILSGTMPVARPAVFLHRVRRDNIRVEICMYVEFLNSCHPFPKLTLDDKIALLKHLTVSFSILEKHYSTMRGGGLQTNRIIHADGTYTDLDDPDSVEYERNGVAGEKLDPETFKKLFILPLKESLHEIAGPMFHNGTTDVEFCALVAILLFDPAAPGLDEGTRRLVKDARDRVYSDWFAYYKAHNIEDGSQRMGNTMLLLPAVQSTVEKTAENFHLIRVFELFDYDKILDDVFSNSTPRE